MRMNFFTSFVFAYVIYLACGGWRFQRVFFLTIRRDMRGLRCFAMMQYFMYKWIWTKQTFNEVFQNTIRKRGRNAIAIFYEDQKWTFDELDRYSNKVANFLLKNGFQRGDKLYLLLHSSPIYIAIWVGAAKIGVPTVLLNYNLRKDSLLHCLKSLNAKGIVVGSALRQVFEEAGGPEQFQDSSIWYVDEKASIPETSRSTTTESQASWNQGIAQVPNAAPPPLARISNAREHLIYIFTSGTTGFPKAAIITKIRYTLITAGCRYSFGISRDDVIYCPLPLYHTAGGICGVGQLLLHGTTLALRSKFSASHYWTDCIKYNCTVAQYIGEVCRYLVAQPPRPTDKQHMVRLAFGNGLRPEVWRVFQERFKVPLIGELYGATESNTSVTNNDGKFGAVGFVSKIIPGVYPIYVIRMNPETDEPVRDPKTGLCILCEDNEPGQMVGRISVHNPSRMFDGYVDGNESRKKVICDVFDKGDSWFASGDVLRQDDLGYLYFIDRLGDTFRWRGENVSTDEVEMVLFRGLPSMSGVVYGVKIPNTDGRAGMAAIQVGKEPLTEEKEQEVVDTILKSVNESLPPYARPIFLRLTPEIEMTSTFKFRKVGLRQMQYDPTVNTEDHLYFLDPRTKKYERLTKDLFDQINSNAIRL